MAASRPAFPSEPNLRRLGVGGGGGGGGGGDRVLRAQLVIALVLTFTVLAVLLYLLRRPSGTENAPADGGLDAGRLSGVEAGALIRTKLEPQKKKEDERVRLGPVQRVKCSAAARLRGNEGALCDRLPFFEEALAKAIRSNVDCAPKTGKEGTVNYVLTVDFPRKLVRVFPGASGQWKGPQAKRSAKCVMRSLPPPQWEAIPHQYRYYMIAILATYPAPATSGDYPTFE